MVCTEYDSFEEAVVTAVNRGHDADTSGAITGQLAGRIYGDGDKAIPIGCTRACMPINICMIWLSTM